MDCIETFLYKGSLYALDAKILDSLQKKFRWTDKTREQRRRTIQRHIRSLLKLLIVEQEVGPDFPKYLNKGIAKDMKEVFPERKDLICHELSSVIGLGYSAYELKKFYPTIIPSLPDLPSLTPVI